MAVSKSRRSTTGLILLIAGALLALAVILPLLGVTQVPWLLALAFLGIAIGLAVMGFGAVNGTLAKITLIAAAAGWLLLAINVLYALPAVLVTIAALVAGIGGLIAAIVLYVGKEIRNTPAILFIATTAVGLVYLLGSPLGLIAFGTLGVVIALLFAAGLIITGVLFRQKESGR
jgi:hypothetical protein